MLSSSHVFHILKFAIPGLVFLWLLVEFGGGATQSRYADVFRKFRDEKNVFVEDFLNHEIDGGLDGSAITELCNNKTWTPGLIMTCDGVAAGISETKSGIMTCLRIGIEIGAEIVLPTIVRRSVIDLSDVIPNDKGPRRGEPLSYFYDEEHLKASVQKYCPQLKLHDNLDGFYDTPSMLSSVAVDVYKLKGIEWSKDVHVKGARVLAHPEKLASQINTLLDQKSPRRERKYPFQVNLRPTPVFLFPTNASTASNGNNTISAEKLTSTFGRLVRVRTDLRRLAATALFNLHKTFDLSLDPRKGVQADKFVGLEMRTGIDVEGIEEMPSYDVQASDALNFLVLHNASIALLGEGAAKEDVATLRDRCHDFHITMVTKDELVDGNDHYLLSSLTYDQRGLVDYEMMLRAGLFVGTAESPFAWNVALRREHAYATPSQMGYSGHDNVTSSVRWQDSYSTLFGKESMGEDFEKTIFP